MAEAWIIDGVRSPRGRGKSTGSLHHIHPQELLAQVLNALQKRVGFDTSDVDDVIVGNGNSVGDHGACIGRMAVLAAGWPVTAPGVTINRFCGSGQQAVTWAAMGVQAGHQDLVIAGGVEWTIQNWADGASSDREFNEFARTRAISAIEYPGLAAVGLGVIAFFFSRVVLAVSKEAGPIIFIVVAAVIFVIGVLIASKPFMKGAVTVVVAVLAAVALIGVGTFAALSGERHELAVAAEEDHYDASHRECGEEESAHYDHLANNTVSLRSAVTATIFVKDGKVYAEAIGMTKKVDTITIPRSNATSVMFRNLDEEDHRLVVNLGSAKVAETGVVEKVGTCTQLTGKNQEQVMTLTIPKPATEDDPYSFTVPGATGEIKLVVP